MSTALVNVLAVGTGVVVIVVAIAIVLAVLLVALSMRDRRKRHRNDHWTPPTLRATPQRHPNSIRQFWRAGDARWELNVESSSLVAVAACFDVRPL